MMINFWFISQLLPKKAVSLLTSGNYDVKCTHLNLDIKFVAEIMKPNKKYN